MPPEPTLSARGAAAPRDGDDGGGGGFSTLFIHRPVATTLLTLAIALAGLVGLQVLPVSPLPQIDFPTISVTAAFPGASPETMAATVATPLERSLGRIAGVTEITSSSSLGNTRITLQFELSRDIDGAARDVQAAINAARSLLPTGMPSNPTYRKVNPADAPVMIVSLTSATLTRGQMYDAASTVLAQRLSQVSGVGNVTVGGGALPAVRVELDLGTLNRAGIALEDVRTAIANTNQNRPKGYIEDATTQWQIGANDQAHKAADYVPVVVAYRNGAAVRLGDVARVIDSVQDTRNAGTTNGKPSIQLQVFRQPGANIIETVDRVRGLLPQLRAALPAALDMQVVMERTGTIRASLREVERALLISVGLVVMVVFLFLRDARATLVPAVAVPVSLIGTCAVMALAGFSINNLTLMALTVATGFVVDDAVVVLENITRHVEEGRTPFAAAIRGAREVGFTVLSMSLSLVAVFIPILAMGGIVGRLFREFAVVLSVAILVSLVVSLTTTPMMAARLVRRRASARPDDAAGVAPGGRRAGLARRIFAAARPRLYPRIAAGYERSLGFALRHPTWTLLVLALTIAANIWLYVIVPKGFFPQQDVGFMVGGIQADQSASFQAVSAKVAELAAIVKADPAVENVMAYTGGGQRNGGFMFVTLIPVAQRGISADQVMARLRPRMARVAGASLFLQSAQDIRIGGRQGNAQYQYTLQSDDLQQLRDWEPRIRAALAQLPELVDVNTDSQDRGLQTSLVIDRAAVARLGLSMRLIDATLNDAFGQRQVATIYEALNQYRVVMEAAPRYLERPESLNDIWIFGPAVNGIAAPVPLAAIAHWETTNTPLAVNHQSTFAASTVSFNLAPGASLGTATRAIDTAMARAGVPTAVHGSFQGGAKAFQDSLASQPILILAALVTIYIVLGVLYESLLHPLTILSTLPSAGLGALLALLATGFEFSLIALIGVILLIGIVKKNAIMMIDVAIAIERREGQDPRTAIQRACVLRLRPILMTTLAAALGALPLALSRGDGTELRQPLGIAIVGGLMVSQLLTLYTTPVVYLALDRARLRVQRWRARRHGPLGEAEAVTP